MIDVALLQCDSGQQLGAGFCKCQNAGAVGCGAGVADLVEQVRRSNVIVAFDAASARHMMWAGVEAAIILLDGPDVPPSTLLLPLHLYARSQSFQLFVQSAAPSLPDASMIDAGVRAARNFGRGVAFCGVKCGAPMKPQLWTPISYEWDNRMWINNVHDAYEKGQGWG